MHTLERFHIALILITMHAATVYGLDASAASCRKYIASSADSLAITTIAKEVACHQKRMLGTIASTVDCNDIASTGFPSSSVTSI
ncbi:MAG TPA: hypothetical protein VN812_06550, partial [Candidatus Acidoferrales bacterium]|nr:hypothetical protein [Candidatus Acidoferrales bacterium]